MSSSQDVDMKDLVDSDAGELESSSADRSIDLPALEAVPPLPGTAAEPLWRQQFDERMSMPEEFGNTATRMLALSLRKVHHWSDFSLCGFLHQDMS